MRLDYNSILEVEEQMGAISLLLIRNTNAYLYTKIQRSGCPRLFYKVKTARGKTHTIPFISKEDYAAILENYKVKKRKVKRTFMGRPYSFCKDCEMKYACTLDHFCEKREAQRAKKAFAKSIAGDDRFWKNGSPKKNLVLCKYAKYRYAHKKTAGQCQKEKCRFYESGRCVLHLDKDVEI